MRPWRWLVYLWAFPTTIWGLLIALIVLLSGGHVRIVDGVLEVYGGATDFCLRRVVGLILRGGASAMTLGHVILVRDSDLLLITRARRARSRPPMRTLGTAFHPRIYCCIPLGLGDRPPALQGQFLRAAGISARGVIRSKTNASRRDRYQHPRQRRRGRASHGVPVRIPAPADRDGHRRRPGPA